MWNAYGPTETTVWASVARCEETQTKMHIGHPLANMQSYILDANMQLVPVGVAGELHLSGVGLARGYLGRSDLTAERFIAHPFSSTGGERLYKTGDLARYQSDGSIEFLGRMDQQVKIRGYRIELGEIETVLQAHPAVQEAVVVLAREDVLGEKRLVAYVVGSQDLTEARLRSFLQEKLPVYMIPSQFLHLDAIPLTPNGKLDHKALPAPGEWHGQAEEEQQQARTGIEEMLVDLWSQVLGRARVGIHDTFFELGGHSLLATQLLARVRTVLGVELPVRAVFESPTVATFAQRVEQALRQGEDLRMPPLVARERPKVLPLSFAQQRLWFLDQLELGSTTYLIPSALCVDGEINMQALERSFQDLIHRHESLRTTFEERDGQPVQVIHPAGPLTLPVIDLQGLAEQEREQQVRWLASQERQHPCDLVTGPLLRTALLRLESQEHVLLQTLHHIITDGWSNGVLVRELTTLYQTKLSGEPSPLAPLPIQYADYTLWQRAWLQGEALQAQLSYWRSQLAGIAPLELPTDHPRPPVQTYRGASQEFRLSSVLSEQLVALSEQQNVTLFMLLLAAFQVLLARYTGQRDIAVGSPIANRRHAEIEGVIGFFVNTLVLRTDLSGDPTFDLVLQRVREVCLGAYAHQDLPFEKVVEELEPERDLSRSPLFQVMLVLQNTPSGQGELAGVSVKSLSAESQISKFDLTLSMEETEQGLRCWLEYNTDLFDASTIARMLSHWQTLLEGVIHNPQVRVSDVPLLTVAELEQLLVQWNATQAASSSDPCVHELFEQQVERTPDAIAVVFEEVQVTYQTLNQRANQLAHHLQRLSVCPEVTVGVCLEKSLQMVVAVLGILKAGGAVVPVDPAYPQERLAFLFTDAHLSVVLTEHGLLPSLPQQQAKIVCLDRNWELIAQEPTTKLESEVNAENLLYVIYTSGSTGRPKGVSLPHRVLVNLLAWHDSQLCRGARTLQFASLSFDASFHELFAAWYSGGTLCMVTESMRPDVVSLANFLCEQAIEKAILPVVMLHQLAQEYNHRKSWPISLHEIMATGEALQITQSVVELFEGLEQGTLHNHYGPSESHVVTAYTLTGSSSSWPTYPPIGRPIANTEIYVLDDHFKPVPIGVVGELYIGGLSLARGYVGRPELTAERFLPHPFSQQVGARLYKTGDMARYRENGALEYLGRIDHQVKLRGYRIELGEIEAVLCSHPGVQEGVTLAREDVPGEKQLVAYVVGSQDLTEAQLRSFLQEKLPTYMIPSQFLLVDAMPLTPNGKLDRKALPAPQPWHREVDEGQQGARTPIEEVLVGLWSKVLGYPQVGTHDRFFELGGHSLLATQLLARVRAVLGVELPVRAVFEAPTVAEFALRVEQALRKGEGIQMPPLVARARPEVLPLSFAQQRLWFLDQFEPDSPTYLVPSAVRIDGNIDVPALQGSLQELISRHESLRTTFEERTGQPPVQIIHPAGPYSLPVIDLQGLAEEVREQQARWLASQERQHPCDLTTGLLLRTSLLRLGSQEHVLLLTLHHIITDGWSNGILVCELTTLYQAKLRGQPSPLAPLPIQYADYALWQREWLQGEVLQAQLTYWRSQLAGIAPLELLTDHPRPPVQTYRGASQELQLSPVLSEQLVGLSEQQNVTLFMLLLATFQVLLARYTGQRDISVGTPIANRRHAEIEGVIGLFVNTLVLRTDLTGDPTFEQMLQRVREVCLGAYAHQDVPFEKVVEELVPERDLSRSPLFQVMLVFQNAPQARADLAGVRVEPWNVETITSKFDLTLSITQTDQGLSCALEYNRDLFEPETIIRMLSHWQTVLAGVVHNPQVRLSAVPLLTEAERVLMLEKWNATQREYPQELCVHELFEQQVERTPDAVALVYEEQQLTYGQLNRRANQLAHHLQMLGVGPEMVVGICLERSLEMVIGLLGVLKAGGAYVPLDPAYPQDRLSYLLEDCQLAVVLTQEHLRSRLPLMDALSLDTQWEERVSGASPSNPRKRTSVDNLAYVIYTSGSTGQPKGVMNIHSGLRNRLLWMQQAYQLTARDCVLHKTPFSFDVSVWEFFWPLFTGARLILAIPGGHQDPAYIRSLITEQQITTLHFVPAMLQVFLQESGLEQCTSLRHVFSSGEALTPELQARFFHRFPSKVGLHNLYGPTEAAIDVTFWECQPEMSSWVIPIGRPIANTQIYILDRGARPVPTGVVGEVYIGGAGLARGYIGRPDLTAEKFLANPFSLEENQRLYKTGDLARYRSDGAIEYLGRLDHQVKLRGYRIELGEIEAALRKQQGIREAVVVVREDRPGEKCLVAYVVGAESMRPTEVRTALRGHLPEYMVPAFVVQIDALPLTTNGKVDRRALPAPEEVWERKPEALQEAKTPIEELLIALWSEVLGCTQVGIHDSFFELGGHSLLATQLIARVREMLEVEISLRAVFEAPTVARFALHVEQELRKSKGLLIPPLVARTRSKEIPLSFAQQRLWFLDQLEPGSTAYLLPNVLHFLGSLNTRAFERSLEELLHRHEILRTTFVAHADQPVQVIHPAKRYCLPVIDLQGVREHEKTRLVEQLAEQEVRRPCDLAEGPLLRVYMFRLQRQDHRVFVTLHHIITDGWSNGVLMRELSTLYQAFIREQCSPLEPLQLQYADYTLWQQQWLQGEILTSLLNYWTKQLRGASPLKLPTDRPRTARVSNHGAIHTFKLPSSLYQSLVALSHQENVTLFMTLLAAFQILLHRYTGMQDIVVGTDVANRTSTETEKIIGFFVNLLVLRVQLSDQETFRELLKSVRTTVLNAYAHQDLPFEKLIDSLQLERNGKQVPLVNVLFVLQNMTQQAFELPGLTVSSIGTQAHTAKFDIAMFLTEEAQELIGYVNYRTDLFQPDSIARLVHHFKVLLQSIVTSPDVIISMLEMITEEEKQHESVLDSKRHEKHVKKLKSAKRIKLPLSPED